MENAIESLLKFDVTWMLVTIISTLIVYLYMKMREKYKYWERKGVTCLKPLPIFGSLLPVFRGEFGISALYKNAYEQFPNEKVVGLYESLTPVLILRDLNLIEKILVKDFKYFTDHKFTHGESGVLNDGLFQMRGDRWRAVRNKITPIFTSGKLKQMMKGMLDCTEEMIKKLRNNLNNDCATEEAITSFVTDVIANLMFGIQIADNSGRKEFESKATSFFSSTELLSLKTILMEAFPKFSKLFGLNFLSTEINNYFLDILETTFKQRTDGIYRNDVVQLLLNLKERGSIEIQSKDKDDTYLFVDDKSPIEGNVELSESFFVGQSFQFLIAGFVSLKHSILYTILELARNPEIQERARLEIKTILGKHGSYTYEALREMTYLEQCIQETFRLYEITGFLFRECTKQYTTDDGLVIEQGTKLIIPVNAIHVDTQYYEDPELFKPERNPENVLKNNFSYMPFGTGPRICIAIRFSLILVKIGLAKILENFKITGSPKNKFPLEFTKTGLTPLPVNKMYLNLTPL